jgi:hypothetical protein
MNRFRRDGSCGMQSPARECQFRVRMLKHVPITYTVPLRKVEDFARHGVAKGPHDVMRKNRMSELLGLSSDK